MPASGTQVPIYVHPSNNAEYHCLLLYLTVLPHTKALPHTKIQIFRDSEQNKSNMHITDHKRCRAYKFPGGDVTIDSANVKHACERFFLFIAIFMAGCVKRGGWGCEVSCGGHHRPRGKTTTGSALDGAVFDIAQILAYPVHNMSRSQLYLGFGHFG